MNFFARRLGRVPFIRQDTAGECGLASLAMVANWQGHRLDLPHLRRRHPTSRRGLTLSELAEAAADLGLAARAFAIDDVSELLKVRCPAILHWTNNHFVVLCSAKRDRFVVNDPAFGQRTYQTEDMRNLFSGTLLELSRTNGFVQIATAKKLTLRRVISQVDGLKASALQVIAISVAVASLSLLLPVIVQEALDDVIPRRDGGLLLALAVAFMAATTLSAIGEWYRQRILLNAGTSFIAQFTRGAVHHIFQLPLGYFEARHPADLSVRLDSIEHIKSVVVQALVTAIVDAIVIVLAAAMMFAYAPALAGVIVATLVIVAITRLTALPMIASVGGVALRARSEERARLMDSLRAIAPLRVGQALGRATDRWYSSLLRHLNAEFKVGNLEANLSLALHIMVGVGTSATMYLGVAAVMANKLTVGMLYAFFTFRTLFFERLDSVVTSTVQLSMLPANMARLRDFAEQKVEVINPVRNLTRQQALKKLSLDCASFTVGKNDKPILDSISLDIDVASCEVIGLFGASGSGKSTLFKLMAGLYQASSGTMKVNGSPLEKFGIEHYRRNVGLLLGTDRIIQGSIVQNISGLRPDFDLGRVMECLEAAVLLNDVENLPWGFDTIVSEEGGLLSTGQRRRLMLARALYQNSSILLLDELISNLDGNTSGRVIENLSQLKVCKVISAHAGSLARHCNRAWLLNEGRLVETDPSEITT